MVFLSRSLYSAEDAAKPFALCLDENERRHGDRVRYVPRVALWTLGQAIAIVIQKMLVPL